MKITNVLSPLNGHCRYDLLDFLLIRNDGMDPSVVTSLFSLIWRLKTKFGSYKPSKYVFNERSYFISQIILFIFILLLFQMAKLDICNAVCCHLSDLIISFETLFVF